MSDKNTIKFQNRIIAKLNNTAADRQEEYDNLLAEYDDVLAELSEAQKMIYQMGYNEFSFAGAERKLN